MPLIFDIKRFSINDGPGIRTTIFLKGCPLSCVWCHNPEGISSERQEMFTAKKCIGCGTCRTSGLEECPTLARVWCGREWPLEELMEQVEKERDVMERSGGGVTICGGEPLLYPSYTALLLDELGRRGFHRAVDTTLFASGQTVRDILPRCEMLLVDLKTMSSEKHLKYCGVPNERILENIRLISSSGARFWIRIPLIEGVNADDENIRASAEFLASLPVKPEMVNLLPYHDIGKGKHERLGTVYNPDGLAMSTPCEALLQHCLQAFISRGLSAIVGG